MKKILLIISLMSNLAIADNIVKQENIYLPPDEAFKVNLIKDSNTRLKIEWDISEGYYLYLGMFEFKTDNPEVQITKAIMPDGLKKTDVIRQLTGCAGRTGGLRWSRQSASVHSRSPATGSWTGRSHR